MEAEHFSLSWKNYHVNLSSGFHELLQSEYLVDVTLAVEGQFIKAHKTILSICSPYFQQLFQVNPCKHPIVIMHGMNYSTLYNILQFMYKGEVSVRQEDIPQFLKVAETLNVKGLTDRDNDNTLQQSSSNGVNSMEFPMNSAERQALAIKRNKPVKPKPYSKPELPIVAQTTAAYISTPTPPIAENAHLPAEPLPAEESLTSETHIVPKEEPVDIVEESDDYNSTIDTQNSMDVSHMLDTQLGESSNTKNDDNFYKTQDPASSVSECEYEYEFTSSRKGMPHLIYLDNLYRPSGKSAAVTTTYTTGPLHDSGSNSITMTHPRRYWECVKNRKTGCKARLLSRMGVVEVKYDQHNHDSQADYIEERKRSGVTYKMSI